MRRKHLYIIKCVCDYFRIRKPDIYDEKNQRREIVIPRQIAVYLIKKHCLFTGQDIANIFGMVAPSWAINANDSISKLLQTDAAINKAIESIEALLPYQDKAPEF